jgi:hypothetical protein
MGFGISSQTIESPMSILSKVAIAGILILFWISQSHAADVVFPKDYQGTFCGSETSNYFTSYCKENPHDITIKIYNNTLQSLAEDEKTCKLYSLFVNTTTREIIGRFICKMSDETKDFSEDYSLGRKGKDILILSKVTLL